MRRPGFLWRNNKCIVNLFDTPEYLITTLSNVKLNLQDFLADLSFRILTKIGHVLIAYIIKIFESTGDQGVLLGSSL